MTNRRLATRELRAAPTAACISVLRIRAKLSREGLTVLGNR